MYRSGKYPKTLSTYIDSLGKKVEAEVVMNTATFVDRVTSKKHLVVVSLEASGVTEIRDTRLITKLLDDFSKESSYGTCFEKGMLVRNAMLDQASPERPVLRIGFNVDYDNFYEWGILNFQEAPRY